MCFTDKQNNLFVYYFLCFQVKQKHPEPIYDLVANIVHDGEPEAGTYRCHILHKVWQASIPYYDYFSISRGISNVNDIMIIIMSIIKITALILKALIKQNFFLKSHGKGKLGQFTWSVNWLLVGWVFVEQSMCRDILLKKTKGILHFPGGMGIKIRKRESQQKER